MKARKPLLLLLATSTLALGQAGSEPGITPSSTGTSTGLNNKPARLEWLRDAGFGMFIHWSLDSQVGSVISHSMVGATPEYNDWFIDGCGEEITKQTAWTLQPDCLVTRGAIETPEQFVPGRAPDGPWETCLTMGTQWQYKPTNEEYKSGTRLIEILIETRAKGGALLLNVGPKPDGALPIEQEERLREVALWHAVNGESIHHTRPWVVTREGHVWFTRGKDDGTVYAFLARQPDWPRSERHEFTLQSVQATADTQISVLGHAGEWTEYAPGTNVTPRFTQTDGGLTISVCRAQRLYNNHKWHNPVVVKLEHVAPAVEHAPLVETLGAKADGSGRVTFRGRLLDLGGAKAVRVGFEYQEYLGFAEAMSNADWTETMLQRRQIPGTYRIAAEGLKPGQEYQFRALVKHPKLDTRGDHKRVTVK